MLNISATKKTNSKTFFSSENWDQSANSEYKIISVQFYGIEIFAKQNGVPKYTSSYSYWLKVVLTEPECPCDDKSGLELAQIPTENWLGQLGAPQGVSVWDLASQGPVRPSQDYSGAVRTTSGQWENELVCFKNMFYFANSSAP